MLSNSQKEHLTYTAIGQIIVLSIVIIAIWQYIIPGIQEINLQIAKSNAVIISYNSTAENGIDYSTLGRLLAGKTERSELIKIIQSDVEGTKKVIQKSGAQSYIDWLTRSIGNSKEDREILVLEKAKLNSIIPTMSPISSNIEEENMTLKQYVKFIESEILRQFNFNSNVVIGMQGVVFGNKNMVDTPENIGMLDFRFDFKGTNGDITKFIDYINTAGKPDILSTGALIGKDSVPKVMSNPLIVMTNFSLQNFLDADNPNGENSGRATLRFYVRGISKDDLLYLRETIKSRQEEFSRKIKESLKGCEKDGVICVLYIKKLTALQLKFQEFQRSVTATKVIGSGTDEIYPLTQMANTIRSLEKELDNILPKDKK